MRPRPEHSALALCVRQFLWMWVLAAVCADLKLICCCNARAANACDHVRLIDAPDTLPCELNLSPEYRATLPAPPSPLDLRARLRILADSPMEQQLQHLLRPDMLVLPAQ